MLYHDSDSSSLNTYLHNGVNYEIKQTNKAQQDEIEQAYYQPSTLQLEHQPTFIMSDEEGFEHGYIIAFSGIGYQYIGKYPDEEVPEKLTNIIKKMNIDYKIKLSREKPKFQITATFQEEPDHLINAW